MSHRQASLSLVTKVVMEVLSRLANAAGGSLTWPPTRVYVLYLDAYLLTIYQDRYYVNCVLCTGYWVGRYRVGQLYCNYYIKSRGSCRESSCGGG